MIHIVPTLSDNYTYVVEKSGRALLVDCGEAAPVIDFLRANNLSPDIVLCTHHHDDHIAGLEDLKKNYPDIGIFAPGKDLPRIADAKYPLADGQKIEWQDYSFLCIETKGHTQNHICFYSPQLEAAFTGDTLFSMGCGRLFEGTPQDMFQSLQKLKSLPRETEIYCGHEYTVQNGKFGLSVEPDNDAIKHRLEFAHQKRKAKEPTLPVTLQQELDSNLFLKAATPEDFARLRKLRDSF